MSAEADSKSSCQNAVARHAVRVTAPKLPQAVMAAFLEKWGKRWCFQLERGEDKGKLHFQCRVELQKKARAGTVASRIRGWLELRGCDPAEDVHVRPEHDAAAHEFYCMKEDTRVAGPWADRPIYRGGDLTVMEKPFPWQQTVMDSISGDADDRTINWIVQPEGCIGKSKLCKFLRYNKKAARVPLGTATQLKTFVIALGPWPAYLVDLPRVRGSQESQKDLFSALEEIKNGDITSAMYGKVQEMMMMPPHVWIFSNEEPNRAFASADRWRVWAIDEDRRLVRHRAPEEVVPRRMYATIGAPDGYAIDD